MDSTPTAVFAQQLVAAATHRNPLAILRLGKKSFFLPLLYRVLPTGLFEKVLAKKYSLDQLPSIARLKSPKSDHLRTIAQ